MKSVCFYDSKLEFVKALLFNSFHDSEAPAAFYCFTFICVGDSTMSELLWIAAPRPLNQII